MSEAKWHDMLSKAWHAIGNPNFDEDYRLKLNLVLKIKKRTLKLNQMMRHSYLSTLDSKGLYDSSVKM